jgi:hypothetical protein
MARIIDIAIKLLIIAGVIGLAIGVDMVIELILMRNL